MPRPIWTGAVSFGLVNIPVKLFTAVKNKDIGFHQIHEQSKCRVHQKLFCPKTGDEISRDEIAKGYEIAKDEYVIVRPEELESIAPEAGHTIEISDFVDITSIDPIYYEKPYYVLPDERAEKPYSLLVAAMKKAGKVAVAKFVMRDKEYLAALRPVGDIILLETMRFADEVLHPDDLMDEPLKPAHVAEKELKTAVALVNALSETFQPEKYRDEYREKLQAMLDKKAKGETIITEIVKPEQKGQVIDLLAALEKSLAKVGTSTNIVKRKKAVSK